MDLFSYYEAVPECEWTSAAGSLGRLADGLETAEQDGQPVSRPVAMHLLRIRRKTVRKTRVT